MSLLPSSAFRAVNGAVEHLVRSGVGSPLAVGGGVIILETTGHVSGKRRHVPLIGARVGNRVTISTVRADSHWLRNVEENASVRVWLGGKRRSAFARVCRGPVNLVTLDVTDDADPVPAEGSDRSDAVATG
jgi:hypothetical protein